MELLYCHFHAALSRPTPRALCIEAYDDQVQPMSEQGVLLLALIDSLAFLRIEVLAEWLPVAAQSIQLIHDPLLSHACKQRFWDVLSDGDMDVERAAFSVTWWSTGGGRRMVLYGKEKPRGESLINGALNDSSKL